MSLQDDQEVSMRIIKYNSMVFDQIFGAFSPKFEQPVVLPVGDGTCCENVDGEADRCPV